MEAAISDGTVVVPQIVMSANKEAVIAEKELSCRFGQEVLVGYSEPLLASSFSSFDGFVQAVQQEWDAQWKRIYTADWSSEPHTHPVPRPSVLKFICPSTTCRIKSMLNLQHNTLP